MLVKETGVVMLNDLLSLGQQSPYDEIPQLARQVINRCQCFEIDSQYVTDDEEQEGAAMNE